MMKILLPIDGSPDALAAVRHALRLVESGLAAEMVLVNVQVPASLYEVVTAHDVDVIEQVRTGAGAELLAPAEALLQVSGLSWQSEVVGGYPSTMLIEVLENYGCDMVVMGARGMAEPDADGLGSVAEALLEHSPVPVTVVRLAEAAEAAEAESESESESASASE